MFCTKHMYMIFTNKLTTGYAKFLVRIKVHVICLDEVKLVV